MAQSEQRIPASLRRRARISQLLTCLVVAFDVVAFRTNWLLPRPLFCGTIQPDSSWVADSPSAPSNKPTAESRSGATRVCVHEVIQPYSSLSGSTTVAMSVHDQQRAMRLFDLQLFIARNLGSHGHNDIPGDWIFLGVTRFNHLGWRMGHSSDHMASWSSQFFSLPIRRQIWRMVQQNLAHSRSDYSISIQRRLAIFVAKDGAFLLLSVAAIYALIEIVGLHYLILFGAFLHNERPTIVERWRRIREGWKSIALNRAWLGRLLFLLILLTLTGVLAIGRYTSWLTPRPFWCRSYAGAWRACLHEIYYTPTKDLRVIVMGVSVSRPDRSHLYASMQFFTALPRDKIGFVDEPGSWHYQDRFYYNPQGLLQEHRPKTLSSIVDPLMPSQVQVALWNDVALEVQEKYKARRLSIQYKLLEVSEHYLFMLLAVLLATWTTINHLEIWILNQELRAAASLKPLNE